MTFEIGIGLQGDKPPGAYAALARDAEAHGIDVISVFADLMYQPPLAALLEIAAATTTVRVGPACLNPFTLHPVEIAGQTAVLDRASEGRAYVGLARGAWLDDVGILAERPLRALEEAAAAVATLLRRDPSGYDGDVFPIAAGTVLRYPTWRSCVPLLIGSWGRRGGELAGSVAEELKVGGSSNPEMVGIMRTHITAGAVSAGRDPDAVGIVLGAVTVVDEDGDAARSRARTEVAMYLAVVGALDPTVAIPAELLEHVRSCVAAGDDDGAGREIPDDILDRFAFSGTPEHVAHLANAAFAAGASRVEFGTPHGLTDEMGVSIIGQRVLPLLDRAPDGSSPRKTRSGRARFLPSET
ncbi:TIGR03842 family LLM class F420-dependent oxidoreductase [soil metagenome]